MRVALSRGVQVRGTQVGAIIRAALACLILASCSAALQPVGSGETPPQSTPLIATSHVPTAEPTQTAPPPAAASPTSQLEPIETEPTETQLAPTPEFGETPPPAPTIEPAEDGPVIDRLEIASLAPLTPDNIDRLEALAEIAFEPWEQVTALAWAPDGATLAAAAGNQVLLVDLPSRQVLSRLPAGGLTHGLAYHPSGRLLAAASLDGSVRVWATGDPGGPQLLAEWAAHRKGATQAVFSPDGALLATAGNDAIVRLWMLEPEGGEPLGSPASLLQEIIGGTFSIPGLAFLSAGDQVALANGALVRLREADGGRMTATLRPAEGEPRLFGLAISPHGNLLAAGDQLGQVWLWDAPWEKDVIAGRSLRDPDPSATPGLIWDLAFSPDGALLAAGSGDGHLSAWDVASGELLASLPAHHFALAGLSFHPEGRLLATGGLDGVLRLWGVPGD